MSYDIVGRVVVVRLCGRPALTPFLGALEDAMADPRSGEQMHLFMDVCAAVGAPPTREIERVVKFFDAHRAFFSGRSAILVSSLLQYGVARIGATLEGLRGREVGVFRNEAEAMEFLAQR